MIKLSRYIGPQLQRAASRLAVMASAVLLGACAATPTPAAQPAPQATPQAQATPRAVAAQAGRTAPCDAIASGQPAVSQEPESAAPETANAALVHYDHKSNTIVLRKGAHTTLAGVSQVVNRPELLQQQAPGEWLLAANLRVEAGALLRVAAPAARWLKLRSDGAGFVWLKAFGGELELAGTCVSSWDTQHNRYDEDYKDGRAFVLARNGARLDIQASDLRYLGYDGPESYGLAWRLSGTSGQVVDSFISHNFYGVYSFDVDDLVIRGNQAHHNVMYGIDPHTGSMRLVIENNIVHDNGKHGIILAEDCSNGVVRNNVAYNNLHHGIVIYKHSNDNLVEGNTAYGNGGHGININDSANTTVRANNVYDNLEAGIGIGQRATATQLLGNSVRANRRDGITLYSDVAGSVLRENTISENVRFGIYVKSDGELRAEGNEVTANAVGVYFNTAQPQAISQATNRIHANREADLQRAGEQAPAATGEERP